VLYKNFNSVKLGESFLKVKFSLHWISTQSVHCVQTERFDCSWQLHHTSPQCFLLFGFKKKRKFEHERKKLL